MTEAEMGTRGCSARVGLPVTNNLLYTLCTQYNVSVEYAACWWYSIVREGQARVVSVGTYLPLGLVAESDCIKYRMCW